MATHTLPDKETTKLNRPDDGPDASEAPEENGSQGESTNAPDNVGSLQDRSMLEEWNSSAS